MPHVTGLREEELFRSKRKQKKSRLTTCSETNTTTLAKGVRMPQSLMTLQLRMIVCSPALPIVSIYTSSSTKRGSHAAPQRSALWVLMNYSKAIFLRRKDSDVTVSDIFHTECSILPMRVRESVLRTQKSL